MPFFGNLVSKNLTLIHIFSIACFESILCKYDSQNGITESLDISFFYRDTVCSYFLLVFHYLSNINVLTNLT